MPISQSVSVGALYIGGALSLIAGFLHFACIFIGAPAFRFLGAGEALARMSERGHWYPPVIALVIGAVLISWSGYALAGAGAVRALPFTKYVLVAIAAVYLARAVSFPLLKPAFPENSQTFWLISSSFCFVVGLAYLLGVIGVWREL